MSQIIRRDALCRPVALAAVLFLGCASGLAAQEAKPDDRAEPPLAPVAVIDDQVKLTPANTAISFVGTHAGEKPDPRTGGFQKFSGTLGVDTANQRLTSIAVEIDTPSIWTEFDKLTAHLQSPDFLDVKQYPKLTFEATRITPPAAESGETLITGNLTLHGVTKSIEFPARVVIADAGLTLEARFTLDRTAFGMTNLTDMVEKDVTIVLAVGRKTLPTRAPAPPPAGA